MKEHIASSSSSSSLTAWVSKLFFARITTITADRFAGCTYRITVSGIPKRLN